MLKHTIKAFLNDKDFNRLLRNGSKLFTGSSVVTIIQFLQVVLLTRFLKTDGYGSYVSLVALVMLVNQFFDVRVSEMAVKFGAEFLVKKDLQRLAAVIKLSYLIDLTTGALAFFVMTVGAGWASNNILHDPGLKSLVQLYTLTLFISTVDNTSSAVLRITDHFGWSSIYAISMAGLEFGLMSLFLVKGLGLPGVIIAHVAKDSVSAIINLGLAWKAISPAVDLEGFKKSSIRLLRNYYPAITKQIFSTNFIAYARMMAAKADVLILAYFRSPMEVGFYKIAMQLSGMVLRVTDPLFVAVLPDLTRLWTQGAVVRFRGLLKKATIIAASILVPAGIAISLLRLPIISILFGTEFAPAGDIVLIAVWGFVIAGVFFWLWPAFLSIGRSEQGVLMSAIIIPVQVAGMYLVAPFAGAIGIAWVYLGIQVLSHSLALVLISSSVRKAGILLVDESIS